MDPRTNYGKYRLEALGDVESDIVLEHCRLVNVLSGEIEDDVQIAISGDTITGVGSGYRGRRTIDACGRYAYPGLIDGHIHLESTKLTVIEAGRVMSRWGTSAVVTDPHEIVNVAGRAGLEYQAECASRTECLDVFITVPSCVPTLDDRSIETSASRIDAAEAVEFADRPYVVGLGEMMNVAGANGGAAGVAAKMGAYAGRGLVVDGHAPMLGGHALNAYVYMGAMSDHESVGPGEALEKLRRGLRVMIREGSGEKNLDALVGLVTPSNSGRFMFASDDLDAADLLMRGHVNFMVARAVARGLPPITALQLATINAASYFGLRNRGAIYPGAKADIVLSPDLADFVPDIVIHSGRMVYGLDCAVGPTDADRLPALKCAVNLRLPDISGLAIRADAPGMQARVIEVEQGQITTGKSLFAPIICDGQALPDGDAGVAKVCVLDRHTGSGSFGMGFVRGFGIRRGALGSSVAHDSHNIIVVGMSDAEILECAKTIADMGGGQAAVLNADGVTWRATLPLPVAGLISTESAENVAAGESALESFCRDRLSVTMRRPMSALSFMALPVIPSIRITDKGLFEIEPGGYPHKVGIFAP